MTKDKYQISIAIVHIIMISVLLFRAYYTIGQYRSSFVESYSGKLNSVVQTMAKMSTDGLAHSMTKEFNQGVTLDETDPRYLRLSSKYDEVLKANGLGHCELTFIVFNRETKQMHRLVSSEPIYNAGEEFKEADPEFLNNFSIGSTKLNKITRDIWKIEVFCPVLDISGRQIGILRAESNNVKSELTGFMSFWPFLIIVFAYTLAAILLTPIIIKQRKKFKLKKVNDTIHDELDQKNEELKMLSLVAKQSENLMLITDEKGQILWVNETYEMKNNYTAEELNEFVGKYLQDVSKNKHINTIIKNVVDFRKAITYESSSEGLEQETYYAMTTVTPISDDDDKVTKLLFVDTDMTKFKIAQKENELFRDFVMKSKLPRIHLTTSGEVKFCNSASEKLLDKWLSSTGEVKDDIKVMLQGIYDSGSIEDILIKDGFSSQEIKLNIHPIHEKNELFIIGESIHIKENAKIDGSS
ncbi:MAG: PAS domain-containing protein [Flavobacteriales bacterium]|nr:PAS domain-containing protein [Flavobacteriales bacterium]